MRWNNALYSSWIRNFIFFLIKNWDKIKFSNKSQKSNNCNHYNNKLFNIQLSLVWLLYIYIYTLFHAFCKMSEIKWWHHHFISRILQNEWNKVVFYFMNIDKFIKKTCRKKIKVVIALQIKSVTYLRLLSYLKGDECQPFLFFFGHITSLIV